MKTDPIIQKALKRWEFSADFEAEDREQHLFALKFSAGGQDQWSDKQWDLRGNNNQPRESYNQCDVYINKVTNNSRMNMPQTRFEPGDDASEEEAEAREDVARDIQSDIQAQIAYDTAVDAITRMGRGYWRYGTAYVSPDRFDQKIEIMWVPNQFAIYDDPTCIRQDKLDRKFLFQVSDVDVNDFNDEYDKNYGESQFTSIGDSLPQTYQGSWGTWDKKTQTGTIRIAEYWEVKTTKSKLYRTKGGKYVKTKPKGEVKDEDVRDVEENKVIWRKITGYEVLEELEWPGKYIPYVRIVGKELYIDGKSKTTGLTQPMIPAQRQYNDWVNAATEMAGMVPISPMVADPIQLEGFEDVWKNAHIKRYSVMPYRRFVNGVDYGAPQRMNNSVDLSAMASLIQLADQNFSKVTGLFPAAFGAPSNETSGKAINARKEEGDVSTYHFQDNFARGLHTGGEILNDLISKIYDGSRVVKGLKENGKARDITINKDFKENGKSKYIDMTKASFNIKVTTGPSYATKRLESADSKMQLVQAFPQIMEVAGANIVRTFDWPGADEIADILEVMAPPQVQALKNDKMKDIPPQVQAKIAQDQQQMQQMQQMLQEIGGQLQQAQAELQSKQQENQLKQADLELKAHDQQIKGQSDQMKAENDRMKLQLEAEKLDFEKQKAEIEFMQAHIQQAQPQQMPQTNGEDMQLSKEALMAQLQHIQEQEQMKADQQSQAEQDQYNQQMMMQQQQEMQDQKDAYEMQKNEALLQTLMGIQQTVAQLTATVAAPKTVVYDENGMVRGVAVG